MINRIYTERGLMYGPAMNVIFSVQIGGRPKIDDLKIAIDYAVNRFEILRCRVLQDYEGQAYYVLREQRCKPDIEVRESYSDLEKFAKEQERIPFHFNNGEMIRFVIETIGKEEVVLRIINHHMGGDGRSILILIDEIMNNLREIDEGRFTYKDKPMIPLTVLSKQYLDSEIKMNDLLKYSMEEFNQKWQKEKRVFTYEDYLAMYQKYWEKNSSRVESVEIHKKVLEKLKIMCKQNHVSVNSAIITAATKEMAESKKISIIVEARPKDYKGMGNFAGSVIITSEYNEKKDFWENAKYIHNQIYAQLNHRISSMFPLVFRGLLDENFQDAVTFEMVGCLDSQLVKEYNDLYGLKKSNVPFTVSNLGVADLEKSYGKFKIEKIKFISPLIPGMKGNFGIITVNNIMTITIEYRENDEMDFVALLKGVVKQFTLLTGEDVELLNEDEVLC